MNGKRANTCTTYPLGLADDLRRDRAPHQAQQNVPHETDQEPTREPHEFGMGDHREAVTTRDLE